MLERIQKSTPLRLRGMWHLRISIIAAIIATRGWLMNEETVLGRVSKWLTWIVIVIVALLVGGYSWMMLR